MSPKIFWSHHSEVILIDFFKNNDFLWNANHPNHKLARKSSKLDELTEIFNGSVTVDEIWKRFGSLRSTFRDNHRKATTKKSGSGADEVFVPTWWHYKRMLFLSKTYVPRCSTGTISEQPMTIGITEDDAEEIFDELETTSLPSSSRLSSAMQSPASTTSCCSSNSLGKRKRNESIESNDAELLKMARQALAEATKETEFSIWAKHVALALEKMTPFHAAKAKLEMEKILLRFHIDNPENK